MKKILFVLVPAIMALVSCTDQQFADELSMDQAVPS